MSGSLRVGTQVAPGDRVVQIGFFGLETIPYPVIVQKNVEGGVVVGRTIDGPPRTNLDGSVRVYPENVFLKMD